MMVDACMLPSTGKGRRWQAGALEDAPGPLRCDEQTAIGDAKRTLASARPAAVAVRFKLAMNQVMPKIEKISQVRLM
jgi:hypothetical protein